MDANQDTLENPFGMDETCTHCDALVTSRTNVVHGYGDVTADFLFIAANPSPGADTAGVPFAGDGGDERLRRVLFDLGFTSEPDDLDVDNAYLTYLTRCHTERAPTNREIENCDGFLTADVRMINPEIIVAFGHPVLAALCYEYTTLRPDDLDIDAQHATTIRGRGFEIVASLPLEDMTDDDEAALGRELALTLSRDYRQTKGQRKR